MRELEPQVLQIHRKSYFGFKEKSTSLIIIPLDGYVCILVLMIFRKNSRMSMTKIILKKEKEL